MGVPAFYKWLVQKYPKIVVEAKQDKGDSIDVTSPNPNEMEFDNLYLDMNGIIHPCFHPDSDKASPPTTFDDVFLNIYAYIDHLFTIVRPRNLLFLAIDGVAPRAKMNQQRSRRFRTAKDIEIAEAEEELLRNEFERIGKQVLPKQDTEVSDSNVITPGTEFMFLLSSKLQEYVSSRISCNPGWKDVKVIVSDANVPGEGEHKIMSFIRNQRTLPGYNPNTRHCLYGLDADLIMLALATHELHFSVLREEVLSVPQPESINFSDVKTSIHNVSKSPWFSRKPYQFLHVWILREYLEIDLRISDPPERFTFDIERLIDDFIFMCFFVGNDFLPCMPTLQIHEQAIDLLMTVYKKNFKTLGGYLVDMQRVNDQKHGYFKLKRVEKFIHLVGTNEEMIFKRRSELYQRKLRNFCAKSDALEEESSEVDGNAVFDTFASSKEAHNSEELILQNTKELKEKLKARLRQKSDLWENGGFGTDKVKLGTADWRKRYYEEKFCAENASDIESTRKEIVQKYTEGLLWVLLYYYAEVPSWTWFYPYHHAPFASDMKGLSQVKVKFQKGSPFKPFDQLMAVLPPKSSQFLPKAYRKLMTDVDSNIIGFYPDEFDVDTDGKRFMWQGICKLPFIDEQMLLDETREVEKEIEIYEAKRNMENADKIFMSRSKIPDSILLPLVSNVVSGRTKHMMNIETGLSGIGGCIALFMEDSQGVDLTFESVWNYMMERDVIILVLELGKGSQHIPRPLAGVESPEKSVMEDDIEETQLWHECTGSRFTTCRMQNRNTESHNEAVNARTGLNVSASSPAGVRRGGPSWNRNSTPNSNRGRGTHNGFIWTARNGIVGNGSIISWQMKHDLDAHGKGRGK